MLDYYGPNVWYRAQVATNRRVNIDILAYKQINPAETACVT